MLRSFLFSILLLLTLAGAGAQVIGLNMEVDRREYLLYEPFVVKVTLRNNAGQDLLFDNVVEGRTWLDFLVTNSSTKALMRPDHPTKFDRMLLPADQAKSILVDVTPLYSMREPGTYQIQTVVQVAGREFVSEPLEFAIVNGNKIWHEDRHRNGSLLTYSLLRFTETSSSTYLYLRVEDASENLVYGTCRLGEIVAFSDPEIKFDAEGNVHVLHVGGRGLYRYTRTDAHGNIMVRDTFASTNGSQPQLTSTQDGSIIVVGGRKEDVESHRERLSEAQNLIKKAPEKPLPGPSSSHPNVTPPGRQ